jgi:phosphatidylserine synthase
MFQTISYAVGNEIFLAANVFHIDSKHESQLFNGIYFAWAAAIDLASMVIACTDSRWKLKVFWPVLVTAFFRLGFMVSFFFFHSYVNIEKPFINWALFISYGISLLYIWAVYMYRWILYQINLFRE